MEGQMDDTEAGVLDDIGILEGTDKTSLRWDYLRQYQEIFRDFRDQEFNLIEIGVASGSSVFTWRKFFTRATIVGRPLRPDVRVQVPTIGWRILPRLRRVA
jgi:hypothetical protein